MDEQARADPAATHNRRTLFGTSGIRGPADEFLSSRFAEKLGRAFGSYLQGKGTVFVGRDVRLHSKPIQTTLMDGLLLGGVDVADCGVIPTPGLLFAVRENDASAGLMVSGSHTPPEIAGVLFFLSDTGEMDSRGERSFESIFYSEPWLQSAASKKGQIQTLEITELYLRNVVKAIGNVGGYKVVVDPGNGATYFTLPEALEASGCSVTTINGEPDGRFPTRPPNPQPSTLTQLSRAVKDSKADLGVGTDSDGDRAIFATADGLVLWGDLTGALFVKDALEKNDGGTIITTVNTSNMVKIICQEVGGRLVTTKVGPPAIAEALRSERGVIFATEESGKHIWPSIIRYGDAALASGKLLMIMKEHQANLQSLVDTLPKFYQMKSSLECPDEFKTEAMRYIIENWKENELSHSSTLDGLKVEYPDLTWFLVRASWTEPLLRCSAEGRSVNEVSTLLDRATKLAVAALGKVRGTAQD